MFERFDNRARRVLVLAQEEARILNHNFIGTEHILLGLIHENDGLAARALASLEISLDAVRAQVEDMIGPSGSKPHSSPPFTPRAKKVLELALREALQIGHNHIGTEHILLGLVREGDGVAAKVLVSLGADLPRVRAEVLRLLEADQPEADAPIAPVWLRVGTNCTLEVVRAGRDSQDVAEALRALADLATRLGAAVDDAHISTEEVETTDGPGLQLVLKFALSGGRAPDEGEELEGDEVEEDELEEDDEVDYDEEDEA